MEDRVAWTWIMRGHGGLVRWMVAMAEEGEGIPAGAAQELKEQAQTILALVERKKRPT